MLSGGWVSGWVEDRMSQNPATMRVPELIVRRRGRRFKSCHLDHKICEVWINLTDFSYL